MFFYADDPLNWFRPRTDGLKTCLVPNDYPEAALVTWFPDNEACPGSLQQYAARKKGVDDAQQV